jgi:hypothetical protein
MLSECNEQYGYMLWLDFCKIETMDVDLMERPQILPFIPKDLEKSDDTRCKKLIDAAKTIASVAHTIVYDADHDLVDIDNNPHRSISMTTSDFQRKVYNVREIDWYREHETWNKVIQKRKYYYYIYYI